MTRRVDAGPRMRGAVLAVSLSGGVASVLAASLGAAAPPQAAALPDRITTLGWLAGCWESRIGARVTEEQWMAPAGGMMLGMNRTVVRDTARSWEYLSIAERDGKLVYTAKPSRQAETSFTSETVSDTNAVFANPAHDFPQRISYRRVGGDSIVARIEGPRGGQMRGIDFPMRRAACP